MRRILIFCVLASFCFAGKAQTFIPPAEEPKDSTALEQHVSKSDVPAYGPGCTVECELEGRDVIARPLPLRFMPDSSGVVTVEIKVNRYGEVSLVTLLNKGTSIEDRDIIEDVFEDAMNTLFNESGTAPVFQMGIMVYHFVVPVILNKTPAVDTVAVTTTPANVDTLSLKDADSLMVDTEPVEKVVEHLEFKKVSIDGPLSDFMNELRKGGFTYKGIKDNVGFLEGTFAGIPNTKIFAFAADDVTFKVVVDFPGQETWPSMKKQYLFFKRSFTSKYFASPRSTEFFPKYIPEGTGREHNAFKEESAVYRSTFDVPNGIIIISVQPAVSGDGKFFLRIEYIDSKNSFKQESAALDDI